MQLNTYEEKVSQCFDSYCKSVLKRSALEYRAILRRLAEREVEFSALTAKELNSLIATDKYFADEQDFRVLDQSVSISESDLASALSLLPAEKREIVIMSYIFGMSDREIAEKMKMARRTVAYQRTTSLQKLKKILEGEV